MKLVTEPRDWLDEPEIFHGEWQGAKRGANICVIVNRIDGAGGGPRLHRHPYAEIFVIRSGEAQFTVGPETFRATAGQILVVPADTPHKFSNVGPRPLETIDIHEKGEFVTEWLE